MTYTFPAPFWSYSATSRYHYTQKEINGEILIEVSLPGIEKQDVDLSHNAEREIINVKIGKDIDTDIYLQRRIDPDNIVAELELGILKIRAPVKNSNKTIQIK